MCYIGLNKEIQVVNFKHMSENRYKFTSKAYNGDIIGSDDSGWSIDFCGYTFEFDD